MPYYVATITISLQVDSDPEAVERVTDIMSLLKSNKNCKPYVEQIKMIARNGIDPPLKVNSSIIRSINLSGV